MDDDDTTIDDGGPAFPVTLKNTDDSPVIDQFGNEIPPKNQAAYGGMSLRDYLAAHAPAPPSEWYQNARDEALIEGGGDPWNFDPIAALIRWRWHYADLMIAERQK